MTWLGIWFWAYLAIALLVMVLSAFLYGREGLPRDGAARMALLIGAVWPVAIVAVVLVAVINKAAALGEGSKP